MDKQTVEKAAGLSRQVIVGSFHHPKTGDLYVRMVPLRPGMIIERNGKRYQVDVKGTQRRVK